MTSRRIIISWIGLVPALGASAFAGQLGSGFTYQGQLKQNNAPLNGSVDLRFDLYDEASTGNLLGTQSLSGVEVSNGLFTVLLNDLGANAFNGSPLWLQVTVNGTPVLPRQPLTATPQALYALNAGSVPWSGITGSPAINGDLTVGGNALINQNVGIGTTTPQQKLHVFDSKNVQLHAESSAGSPALTLTTLGQSDWILGVDRADSGKLKIQPGPDFTGSPGISITPNRNVGIGTNTPQRKLHLFDPADVQLHIDTTTGSPAVTMTTLGQHDWIMGVDRSDNGYFKIRPSLDFSGNNGITLNAFGWLGVGTSAPANKLSVYDTSNVQIHAESTFGSPALTLTTQGQSTWIMGLDQANSGKLKIQPGLDFAGNPGITIDNNRNVGLGTTNPETRLSVDGTVQVVTGAANYLAFGTVGNFQGSAENTDLVAFQRNNFASNGTELRLIIGDDTTTNSDRFTIMAIPGGTPTARFVFDTNGTASKPGGGSWATLSDVRMKQDIAPLTGALDRVLQLKGFEFDYTDDAIKSHMGVPGRQIGLIAQDVEQVFPDWVNTDRDGIKSISERGTTALFVESLRELRAEKDAQLDALRAANAELNARLEKLEKSLGQHASVWSSPETGN